MTNLALALQAESAAERWQAIEKLNRSKSKLADVDTLSELLKALADEHPFVRWQAGVVLAGLAEGSQKLAETLKNALTASTDVNATHIAAADALAHSHFPAAYGTLVKALDSDNARLRSISD